MIATVVTMASGKGSSQHCCGSLYFPLKAGQAQSLSPRRMVVHAAQIAMAAAHSRPSTSTVIHRLSGWSIRLRRVEGPTVYGMHVRWRSDKRQATLSQEPILPYFTTYTYLHFT